MKIELQVAHLAKQVKTLKLEIKKLKRSNEKLKAFIKPITRKRKKKFISRYANWETRIRSEFASND